MKSTPIALLRDIAGVSDDLAADVALRVVARWVVDPETGKVALRWRLAPVEVSAPRARSL
jgi:hypothetical protein